MKFLQLSIQRIVLVLFGVTIAILISVITDRMIGNALRLNGYFKALSPSVTDIYTTTEYSYEASISSQGIRNPIVTIPKPKDTYRILVIGDSFTYGWGVTDDNIWTRLVEKNIHIAGKHIEVINAGAPGASPVTATAVCQAYRDWFEIDAVVYGWYGIDDLYQLVYDYKHTSTLGSLIERLWPTFSHITMPVINQQWHGTAPPGTRMYLSDFWKQHAQTMLIRHPDLLGRLDRELIPMLSEGKINTALLESALVDKDLLIKMLDRADFSTALHLADRVLNELQSQCIENRPSMLVMLPGDELVSRAYHPYRQKTGYQTDDRLVTLDLDTPFSELAKKHHFAYVTLLPDFRKDECPDCFYPWDAHMTPTGNLRVADVVAPKLNELVNRSK